MCPADPTNPRRRLQLDALCGGVICFAVLAVIQATINVLRPEPAIWPAALALLLVIAAVALWRARRDYQ